MDAGLQYRMRGSMTGADFAAAGQALVRPNGAA